MKHIWRPFTQMKLAPERLPRVSRAKKALLTLETGETIIDAVSSWWVITHGHCDPWIVREVQKQAGILDQTLFANFTHAPAENLVKELSSLLPKNLQRLFFSDDGSTAVEVALKAVLQSQRQRGRPERKKILTFQHSYHGDTVGAMSVSGPGVFTKPYRPFLFSVIRAKQGRFSTDSAEVFYRDFERQLERHHKTLAGVIIEPFIQGAGGMILWPKKALNHICRLTQAEGAYVIFDEVMTGFGRTGSLFAFEQLNAVPDILCLAKGLTGGFLPLALTVFNEEIYQSFLSEKKERSLFHGHSFTGNPISCSAAVGNLRKLKKYRASLQKKWKLIESIHRERGSRLKNRVKDVRWKGVMAALEPETSGKGWSSRRAELWTKKALERGVFLRPLGDVLYTLPPYSISPKELNKVWDVMEELLDY